MNLADSAVCSYAGTFFSDGGSSNSTLGFTAVEHNYPSNPLPKPCWVSSFYDAVREAGAHHAEDLVYDNGNHNGGTVPAYGTPVTAMESGTVVAAPSGYGPASYPGCLNGNPRPPGNYVKIQGADNYFTIYYHMKPGVSVGQKVNAGQVIGTLDNSGCQSAAHLHVGRKNPSGNTVNFTIPCTNQLPTKQYYDGLVDDAVPDNL